METEPLRRMHGGTREDGDQHRGRTSQSLPTQLSPSLSRLERGPSRPPVLPPGPAHGNLDQAWSTEAMGAGGGVPRVDCELLHPLHCPNGRVYCLFGIFCG